MSRMGSTATRDGVHLLFAFFRTGPYNQRKMQTQTLRVNGPLIKRFTSSPNVRDVQVKFHTFMNKIPLKRISVRC